MTVRTNAYFREHLTPEVINLLEEQRRIDSSQLFRDAFELGIVGNKNVAAEDPASMFLAVPRLVAYTGSGGLRLFIGYPGRLSLEKSGDLKIATYGEACIDSPNAPLADLPTLTAGQEMWISVLAMYVEETVATAVDGYGDEVDAFIQDKWRLRVLYGTPASAGSSEKPDLDPSINDENGVLLADVYYAYGQISFTVADLDFDRVKYMRLTVGAAPAGSTGGLNLDWGRFSVPLGDLSVGSSWQHKIPINAARARRIEITYSHLQAPPDYQIPALITGDSIVQIDKSASFGAPISVTLPQASPTGASAASLELDIVAGDQIYIKCTQANGHNRVTLDIDFVVLE